MSATPKPALMVATPAYGRDGRKTRAYAQALALTTIALERHGIGMILPRPADGSLVYMNCNQMAAEFLATPATTHIMWIDADLGWRPDDLLRLLSHDVDLVFANCRLKQEEVRLPSALLEGQILARQRDDRELIRMEHGPLGFALMKRAALTAAPEASSVP